MSPPQPEGGQGGDVSGNKPQKRRKLLKLAGAAASAFSSFVNVYGDDVRARLPCLEGCYANVMPRLRYMRSNNRCLPAGPSRCQAVICTTNTPTGSARSPDVDLGRRVQSKVGIRAGGQMLSESCSAILAQMLFPLCLHNQHHWLFAEQAAHFQGHASGSARPECGPVQGQQGAHIYGTPQEVSVTFHLVGSLTGQWLEGCVCRAGMAADTGQSTTAASDSSCKERHGQAR